MKIYAIITLVCSLALMGCYLKGEFDIPPASSIDGVPEVLPTDTLEITYIANEGVFIRIGDKQVLIDALHKPYRPAYMSTPPEIEALIMEGAAPFDDVDFLLVSHVHKDHFDAATVADYLSRQSEVSLFSSGQVIDSVLTHARMKDAGKLVEEGHRENMVAVPYVDGVPRTMEKNGILVTAGKVAHGSERFRWVENLGHVVQIEERSILHVGDPGFGRDDIERLLALTGKIDIAFLPSWFITEPEGREVIGNIIQPAHLVIVHVSPDGVASVKRVADTYYPEATVFSKPMESIRF
ncbi:MAG: MBL fold metallo-hydrolase [Rhodothermales bacterium]